MQRNHMHTITPQLERVLRGNNPFWTNDPLRSLPAVKRWAYGVARKRLTSGLAKAVVLTGPRQVGKSTLVLQIIESLLSESVSPERIFYVQFDELPEIRRLSQPIIELTLWYEQNILRTHLNTASREGRKVYLFFDEVQNLPDWSDQIKHLVDSYDVHVMVTGSSALRIEQGRDSLAGRITTLEMGTLLLREISYIRQIGELAPFLPDNGISPMKEKSFWLELRQFGINHTPLRKAAFQAFSDRGTFPIAHNVVSAEWDELASQLNETIIRRAITHDLRTGIRGAKRDEHLLEEVFRLACRYAGQSPSQPLYEDEIRRAMNANIGKQRIFAYLKFLDNTLLLRLIEPLELRLKRKRGASKVCICDHALRASWLQEVVPLDPESLDNASHLRDLAGHIAESSLGYFLKTIPNIEVAHFPERGAEPEVDFILTVGDQRIPIEVKYRRRIDYGDTRGLRTFIEKAHYNAPFGVLVTLGEEQASDDPRIVSMPLSTILLLR